MITSKQINCICEEYFNSTKTNYGLLELFVNPTKSELVEASKVSKEKTGRGELRFFAVSSQRKMYVFDAYLGYHLNAAQLLNLPSDAFSTNSPNIILLGMASVYGQTATMTSCDVITLGLREIKNYTTKRNAFMDYLKRLFNLDWTWCDKYVNCSSFINDKKKEFEDFLKTWRND